MTRKVLFVATSNAKMGETGKPTGLWLEEIAAPYVAFTKAGFEVVVAAPAGGKLPVDAGSLAENFMTEECKFVQEDPAAKRALENAVPLADIVAAGGAAEFAAVFYPGGHGVCWDLPNDSNSKALIQQFAKEGKPIAAVCHGPWAFRYAVGADGTTPLLAGTTFTAFSDSEEAAVGLTDVVPFSMQRDATTLGATFVSGPDWAPFAQVSGNIVTGQNPASSKAVAEAVIAKLGA